MLVSKELLSEVLGYKVDKIEEHFDGNFDPCFLISHNGGQLLLNIYEFMYLCKEWAFQQRYNVYSLGKWRDSNRDTYLSYSVTIKTFEENIQYAMNKCYNDKFYADTEPEAVFKACEWILENK